MNKNTFKQLFQNRNFRLLFTGEAISNLGDQFTFIGLAWLVTRMTDSAAAVGLVLALSGFPRAILMLVSGAVVDKMSSRKVMMISNVSRFIIVLTLALLTISGDIKLWMIYIIALLFGIADAFFIPARTGMVPQIVKEQHLGAGNTLIQGLGQLSQFVGPFLVGMFIGYMESITNNYYGIGFVMIIDAITFLISLWTLYIMPKTAPVSPDTNQKFMSMLLEGFSSVLQNKGLRYLLVTVACINFSFLGPFLIGVPLIAKNQLLGAYSYGFIMSSWGIGALVGYFIAGFTARPQKNPTMYFLYIVIIMGILFSLFSFAYNTYQFVFLSFFAAVSAGYVMLSLLTLIQKHTTPRLMGRTMSIVIFFWIGLNPLSELVAGNVIEVLGNDIFKYAGLSIITIATMALFSKNLRNYGNV